MNQPSKVMRGDFRSKVHQLTESMEGIEGLAKGGGGSDNDGMEYVPRPELDSKLQTIEVKMDGRFARIEDRFNSIDATLTSMARTLESQKNVAWKAAAATIAAMIATIIAVAALGFSAFDSGRDTANLAASTQTRVNEVMARTEQQQQETQKLLQDAIKAISQSSQK